MPSFSKREFLGQMAIAAGGGLLQVSGFRPALAAGVPGSRPIWSVDAAGITVSKGMWEPETLPSGVRFESIFLKQPDGVLLHALLYFPANLRSGPKVPALLSSDPYRREPTSPAAGVQHLMARNGFVDAYLGVRGSGTSEGIPTDEYAVDENEDTARFIDWLSKQPWSNGKVGMYGRSYSAFNSVWVAAALKPPALKAIFVLAGTHNRYTDDIHYPGGTMVMVNNAWALGMLTSNATPGAPDYAINSKASLDRWNTPPWLRTFLHYQTDGPHWQRGSLWPDYSRLTTPTFLGGGYLDKYQNFVPLIMKNSPAVTKGILGPWQHSMEWPGPVLDWNALMTRWFDHWLKGKDSGMLREPRVSFYMPRWYRQSFRGKEPVPGEWRHLEEWPDTVFAPPQRFYLRPDPEMPVQAGLKVDPAPGRGGRLSDLSGPASALKLKYYPGRGGTDQSFGPTNSNGYFGIDHRDEDMYGLCFDTDPLREPVEILGFVKARLFVSATAPVANWVVRLHDLAPDGTSYLITRGFLNGTHRKSHTNPEPLKPDEIYEIAFNLMCTGYKFEPGHRIRVIVSNADFPVIWPSPYAMTTTLYTGGDRPSHIALPILPPLHYLPATLPITGESLENDPARANDTVRTFTVAREYPSGETIATCDIGRSVIECRVNENDPGTASLHLDASTKYKARDGRILETQALGALRSTADSFIWSIEATILENGKVARSLTWSDEVPRDLL